jgi:TRAP-type C4-dicarboxylate transport system substrate-binding protein
MNPHPKWRGKRLLCAMAVALGVFTPGAAASQTELKFAVFPPAEGVLVKDVLAPWVKEVNAAMGDVAHIRMFAGGTLGRDPVQQYKLVRDKVVDIAYVVLPYTPGDFPFASIFELPFLFGNSLEASLAHWRMYERGLIRYDRIKFLGGFAIPPQSLHSKQKIAKLDDLKGQKIRSGGSYQSMTIEALGGTAIGGIPVPGVAEAISRGVIDGALSDWNGIFGFRIGDAAKNHFELPLGSAAAGIFMNLDAWNALPPAAKAAIEKASGEALSRRHGIEFDKRGEQNFTIIKGRSEHTIVIPSTAEREAAKVRVQPVTSAWLAESPDRKKLYDATVAILEEIRSRQ